MKEFKVFVKDKPGELARVTEALAEHAVNIRAIASEGGHENSFLRIVTNDVATTQKAFKLAGIKYDANELLTAELMDRPGELAKIARRLARAGVNVESIYGMVVSDMEKGKSALR